MSQKNTKTVNKSDNWFKTAYNSLPKNQISTTRQQICDDCECSEKTFYRWMQKGFVPSQRNLKIICDKLSLDVKTRKPLLKPSENN